MERLTEWFDDGIIEGVLVKEEYGNQVLKTLFEEMDEGYLGMCVLKAYEDTGLSVSDIQVLKKRLSRENATEIARLSRDNDGWIPVEERLPEESLESVIGWDEYRERSVFVQYYTGLWILGNGIEPVKIVAWRPLPDPYHTEGKRN